jgi:hypothetical protein
LSDFEGDGSLSLVRLLIKQRLFTISQKRKKSIHYIATTFGFEIYHRSKDSIYYVGHLIQNQV